MNPLLRDCVRAVLPTLFAVGVMVVQPLAAAERTYKWVDEKGQVHYGGTPPPGIKAEQIAGPPPPPTGTKADGGAASAKQLEKKPAANGGANDSTSELDKAQCELSKKNLETLKSQSRISIKNTDGSTRVMPEEERAEQIRKAEENVKNFCK